MSTFADLKQQLHSGHISYTSFYYSWQKLAATHSAELRKKFTDKGFQVSGTTSAGITLKTDDNGAIWQLSIIYPDDAPAGILETALIHDGSLVYIDECDYSDVRRFNDHFDDLLAEVHRLQLFLNK